MLVFLTLITLNKLKIGKIQIYFYTIFFHFRRTYLYRNLSKIFYRGKSKYVVPTLQPCAYAQSKYYPNDRSQYMRNKFREKFWSHRTAVNAQKCETVDALICSLCK